MKDRETKNPESSEAEMTQVERAKRDHELLYGADIRKSREDVSHPGPALPGKPDVLPRGTASPGDTEEGPRNG